MLISFIFRIRNFPEYVKCYQTRSSLPSVAGGDLCPAAILMGGDSAPGLFEREMVMSRISSGTGRSVLQAFRINIEGNQFRGV